MKKRQTTRKSDQKLESARTASGQRLDPNPSASTASIVTGGGKPDGGLTIHDAADHCMFCKATADSPSIGVLIQGPHGSGSAICLDCVCGCINLLCANGFTWWASVPKAKPPVVRATVAHPDPPPAEDEPDDPGKTW